MKIVNHKILTYALLVLMFCVAVSGGCGGGSSGHYSGNFGDSGDSSVTPEIDTQDVIQPELDEPSLSDQFGDENDDDEYGASKINALALLNNTTWNIESLSVFDSQTLRYCTVKEIQNKTITLMTTDTIMSGGAIIVDDKREFYPVFKTEFYAPNDVYDPEDALKVWYNAPVLRYATKFVETEKNSVFEASNGTETERIQIIERFENTPLVATRILIVNHFVAVDGKEYTSSLELSRVDNFSILDYTDWKIRNIQIVGQDGIPEHQYIVAPHNAKNKKITLRTNVRNNVGVLNFMIDDNNSNEPFTITFRDLSTEETAHLIASILRPASDLRFQNKQGGYEIFEAKLLDSALPEQYREGNKVQEMLYVSDYGPNGYIVIRNSFYAFDSNVNRYRFYWVTLELEPYIAK